MKKIQLGSVSTGTLRTEDLIDALAGEISYLEIPGTQEILSEVSQIKDFDTEESSFILEELFEKLNEYAPPHMQFNAHDGDGADFGWWTTDFDDCELVSLDNLENHLTLSYDSKQIDISCNLLVEINDHGNTTVKELGGAVIWDCV